MNLPIKILDGKGTGKEAFLHERDNVTGLVTFTERLNVGRVLFQPFLNDNYGNQMAIAVTFGGTPEGVYNGADSALWTATITAEISAGSWDLTDTLDPQNGTQCLSLTGGNNADEVSLADGGTTDMTTHTALTGGVQLDTYNSLQNSIILQFYSGGVPVGNSVDLNDFIDTGILGSYQSFAITKEALGIDKAIVDEMTVTLSRTGGPKPTFRLDDMQIEETGSPIEFKVEAPPDTLYYVDSVVISYADAYDATLLNSSMPNLSHNQILGVASLDIGTTVQYVRKDTTVFSASIRTLGDSIKGGSALENIISDGTDTCITLRTIFNEPVVLDRRTNDKITFTVNDDLSGLAAFHVLATGRVVSIDASVPIN